MKHGADIYMIAIRKRPWWLWALAGFWLLLEVLLLQTALASVKEEEYRAATISGIATIILAGGGFLAWLRQGRSYNPDEPTGRRDDTSAPV